MQELLVDFCYFKIAAHDVIFSTIVPLFLKLLDFHPLRESEVQTGGFEKNRLRLGERLEGRLDSHRIGGNSQWQRFRQEATGPQRPY